MLTKCVWHYVRKCVLFIVAALSLIAAQSSFAAVEINTADQAQLDSITGIGPSTSHAILEERKKNGNFRDWADLEQRVRGIGERNSVKLSAAGLVVNGQARQASAAADKPAKHVGAVKAVKAKAESASPAEEKH